MSKRKIIGLTGRAGVGKTTTADMFVKMYKYKKLSFATPLKEALSVLTGLHISYFTNSVLKEIPIEGLNNISPRIFMQKFATEFIREMIHNDFWVWKMENEIDSTFSNIIIDDVRFENEADLIRNLGGVIVHLERDFESIVDSNHKSEQKLHIFSKDIHYLMPKSPEIVAEVLNEKVNWIK